MNTSDRDRPTLVIRPPGVPRTVKAVAALKWRGRERAITLLAVVLVIVIGLLAVDTLFNAGALYDRIFYPPQRTDSNGSPEWRDIVQALLLLLGLPTAFLLWHWRDLNVREQIENQRKDTNLREFQEIQLRAAGALDTELPEEARDVLQIAALHQLRPYLRGEHGDAFRRPAFEVYCAMLALPIRIDEDALQGPQVAINPSLSGLRGRIYHTIRDIIHEEHVAFFRSGFPLRGRAMRGLHLSEGSSLDGLDLTDTDLSGAHFVGVNLALSSFNNANILKSIFMDCIFLAPDFSERHLRSASLTAAI